MHNTRQGNGGKKPQFVGVNGYHIKELMHWAMGLHLHQTRFASKLVADLTGSARETEKNRAQIWTMIQLDYLSSPTTVPLAYSSTIFKSRFDM